MQGFHDREQKPRNQGSGRWRLLLAVAILAPASGASARAGYVFATDPAASVGGQPVDAQATFTITQGHISISVVNLEVNPKSDIQTINGIQFVLGSGLTVASNVSGSALERSINKNGTYTDLGVRPFSWNVHDGVGGGIELTSIGNKGGAPTLIGAPGAGGLYSAANGSIAGSGPHNPFLAGIARIELDVPGLLATTAVKSLKFEFGTASGATAAGFLRPTPYAVPEPSALVLLGVGGAAVATLPLVGRWRGRAQTPGV